MFGPAHKYSTTFSHVFDALTDGWCGPYVSDNKFQSSVADGTHKPKTKLGRCCKQHDRDLALKIPPAKANADFEACAVPTGLQGKIYSNLVNAAYGTSSMPNLRPTPPNVPKNKNSQTVRRRIYSMPKNVMVVSRPQRPRSRNRTNGGVNTEIVLAPSAVGHVVGGGPARPNFSRNGDSVTMSGQEIVISLATAQQSSNFELVGGHRFNPHYFLGSRMNYLADLFEEYKFDSIEISYITGSSSATTGDILLTYEDDPTVPFRNPVSSNFVNKALSKKGAVLCSVWKDFTTSLNIEKSWRYTVYDDIIDPRSAIAGDVFLYSRGTITQPGYIMCRYTVSFRKPIFNPRSFSLETWGDWSIVSATQAANPTVGNTVILTLGSGAAVGEIFKFAITSLTLGTGVTAANAWYISESGTSTAFTLGVGSTFYGAFGASNAFYVYPSLIEAKASPATNLGNANTSSSIIVQTANTTTSTFYLAVCQMNLAPASEVVAQ